jgi:hypothetical protein
MRTFVLPSPLVGEGGPRRGSDEGSKALSGEVFATPHPSLRDTFSHKGRRGEFR